MTLTTLVVCCNIKLQPKKLHNTKQKGKRRINITGMHLKEKVEEFSLKKSPQKLSQLNISTALQPSNGTTSWRAFRKQPLQPLGRKLPKVWFDSKFSDMSPVIDAKRAALAEYKHSPVRKPSRHPEQQEASARDCQTMCKRILAVAQRLPPVCSRFRQYQGNVRGNKKALKL